MQATNGDLYGTTQSGGANCAPNGCGTIFKITAQGALTTLYSFCAQSGCTDGEFPYAGLVHATNGNFYGTAESGGANGYGTVFRITPTGTLTTLYSFCYQTGCTDGEYPYAPLVQATDGALYGTTQSGGAKDYGTIFRITPSGMLTMLHSFCSQSECRDGEYPNAGLVQATNGDFYGTAVHGGGSPHCTESCGSIFGLSVGLKPFVKTQPEYGIVGAAVNILGTNLTGATGVTFNGTAAVFTVVSNTEIAVTVPVGASSGKVQVITPGGMLPSNMPFHVLP